MGTGRHTLARLLAYAAPYRRRLAAAFGVALCGALMELARPWPIKIVADHILGDRPLPPRLATIAGFLPLADQSYGLLGWTAAVAVLIVAAGALCAYWTTVVAFRLGQAMVIDLSAEVFARLLRLSLDFHGRHPVGDLLQRIGGDVFVLQSLVLGIVLPASVSLVALFGMFAILVAIDPVMAGLVLLALPLLAAAATLFARPLGDAATLQSERQGAFFSLAEQSLSAVRAVQAFAREAYVQGRVEHSARALGDAYTGSARTGARYSGVISIIVGGLSAAALGIGAIRVVNGNLTLGDLLVVLGYVGGIIVPVTTLSTVIGASASAVARARRVFEVLDASADIVERPGAVELARARGEIVFENVNFGYPGENGKVVSILRGVSFRTEPGQTIAIVGATGAGKTTLVSLLPRLHDVTEGVVRIDGHDVRDVSLRSLRENIAVVLQEPFLFPMTIAENIGFGRPTASRAEIVEAARIAQAHDFISALPMGYETRVGERGATLSGGERQRIAIARALLKDAPILLLDEPTASLDARTEASLLEALRRLMAGRTTFIVSHRLATIRRADQILTLEHGVVVDHGTHERLIAGDHVYARLFRYQEAASL